MATAGMGPDGSAVVNQTETFNTYDHDWFFGRITPECNDQLSYDGNFQPPDLETRVFMAVLWAVSALAVVLLPRNDRTVLEVGDDSESKASARWDMLDAVRIGAIVAVVCEHSGGTPYSYHNTGFATMMVLPWLFITSGIGFMMSRSGPIVYFGRLLIVFVIGIGCNVVGDVLGRPGWQDDLGDTIYQMNYVIGITVFALASWPLKAALKADAPAALVSLNTTILVGYLLAWGTLAGFYLLDFNPVHMDQSGGREGWGAHIAPIVNNFWWMASHVSGFLVLVALHRALDRANNGVLPWILVLYIYVPRVLVPTPFALAPMMFFFYLIGLTVQKQPFAGALRLAELLRSYWFLCIVFLIVLSVPDLMGRCDLYPATTTWERFRWDFVEFSLAIALLTKVLTAADPLRIVAPLNMWALFAFLTHVMLARALPVPSTGAAIEVALMPVFVLIWKLMGWLKGGSSGGKARELDVGGETNSLVASLNAQPPDVKVPMPPGAAEKKPYGTFGSFFRHGSGR